MRLANPFKMNWLTGFTKWFSTNVYGCLKRQIYEKQQVEFQISITVRYKYSFLLSFFNRINDSILS